MQMNHMVVPRIRLSELSYHRIIHAAGIVQHKRADGKVSLFNGSEFVQVQAEGNEVIGFRRSTSDHDACILCTLCQLFHIEIAPVAEQADREDFGREYEARLHAQLLAFVKGDIELTVEDIARRLPEWQPDLLSPEMRDQFLGRIRDAYRAQPPEEDLPF